LTRRQGSLDEAVATVLKQEMEPIFRGRDAHQMNAEFLAANSKALEALFESECVVSRNIYNTLDRIAISFTCVHCVGKFARSL
jgi:hypothetical protein